MHGHQLRLLAEEEHVALWTDITVGSLYGAIKRLAAEELIEEGISAEVIDLRSLRPLDWDAIARGAPVLVLYMASRNLPNMVARLLAGGRRPDEPVAIVSRMRRFPWRIAWTERLIAISW